MSVLESLKGTFHNVQQDIFDGLRALTSLESSPRNEIIRRLHEDGVSLDAGADLLNRFQITWQDLQAYTSDSAKKAEDVDAHVNHLFVTWEKRSEHVSHLEEEIKELPNLLSTITTITNNLGYLQDDFRKVELSLERLEDVIEQQEHHRNKLWHSQQLAAYKQVKQAQLEKVKVQLAKEHAKKMQEFERHRHVQLKERQEAFGEAFTHDVDFYRTHGRTERTSSTDKELPKVTSLSQICIDEDKHALDDFLASTDVTPASEHAPAGIHDDTEGAFFEDDYTADYTVKVEEDVNSDEMEELISMSRAQAAADLEKEYLSNDSDDRNTDGVEKESNVPDIHQSVADKPASDNQKGTSPMKDEEESVKGDNSSVSGGHEANDPDNSQSET